MEDATNTDQQSKEEPRVDEAGLISKKDFDQWEKSLSAHSGPTDKLWNRLGTAAIIFSIFGGLALMIWASAGK